MDDSNITNFGSDVTCYWVSECVCVCTTSHTWPPPPIFSSSFLVVFFYYIFFLYFLCFTILHGSHGSCGHLVLVHIYAVSFVTYVSRVLFFSSFYIFRLYAQVEDIATHATEEPVYFILWYAYRHFVSYICVCLCVCVRVVLWRCMCLQWTTYAKRVRFHCDHLSYIVCVMHSIYAWVCVLPLQPHSPDSPRTNQWLYKYTTLSCRKEKLYTTTNNLFLGSSCWTKFFRVVFCVTNFREPKNIAFHIRHSWKM